MCFHIGEPSWHHLPNLSTPISPAPHKVCHLLSDLQRSPFGSLVPEAEFCHLDLIEMAPYSGKLLNICSPLCETLPCCFLQRQIILLLGWVEFHFAIISQHICLFYYRKTFGLFPIWGYHELCFRIFCELWMVSETFWGPLGTYSCWSAHRTAIVFCGCFYFLSWEYNCLYSNCSISPTVV